MSFEPEKFFIGVLDFFAVLLPGALLTFLVKDTAGPAMLGDRYRLLGDVEAPVVFLFSAYVSGHFVFMIGAWLLDAVYDRIRGATHRGIIRRLAKGAGLPWPTSRLLARMMVDGYAERAQNKAIQLKNASLTATDASKTSNAFQWAKARIRLDHPDAMATVERFEADSKFFRSFCVVLVVIVAWTIWPHQPPMAGSRAFNFTASLVLLVLALLRYFDQRLKATTQAYRFVLTAESEKPDVPLETLASGDTAARAGGVVYRRLGGKVVYLLTTPSDGTRGLVIPKGHVKLGEDPEETAVREVREETGIWARVRQCGEKTIETSFTLKGENVTVQYFLMAFLGEDPPAGRTRMPRWLPFADYLNERAAERRVADERRKPRWLSLGEAMDEVHRESSTALGAADDLRERLEADPAR